MTPLAIFIPQQFKLGCNSFFWVGIHIRPLTAYQQIDVLSYEAMNDSSFSKIIFTNDPLSTGVRTLITKITKTFPLILIQLSICENKLLLNFSCIHHKLQLWDMLRSIKYL